MHRLAHPLLYTPKSHLRPHRFMARLPALVAKPSQNSRLLTRRRLPGARRFTTATACSPRTGRKDSGPHSPRSSLFCSPETRTGCPGSRGLAGLGGPQCHQGAGGSSGWGFTWPRRQCSWNSW